MKAGDSTAAFIILFPQNTMRALTVPLGLKLEPEPPGGLRGAGGEVVVHLGPEHERGGVGSGEVQRQPCQHKHRHPLLPEFGPERVTSRFKL